MYASHALESISQPDPQVKITKPTLDVPVFLSHIMFPSTYPSTFYVLRCGDYGAIIDCGVNMGDINTNLLIQSIGSNYKLLADASEIELFITHSHNHNMDYMTELMELPNVHLVCCEPDGRFISQHIDLEPEILPRQCMEDANMNPEDHLLYRMYNWNSHISDDHELKIKIMVPPRCGDSPDNESIAIEFSVPMEDGSQYYKVLFTGDMQYEKMRPFSYIGEGETPRERLESSQGLNAVDLLIVPSHGNPEHCSTELFEAIPCKAVLVPSGQPPYRLEGDLGSTIMVRLLTAASKWSRTAYSVGTDDIQYIITNVDKSKETLEGKLNVFDIVFSSTDQLQRLLNMYYTDPKSSEKQNPPKWLAEFAGSIYLRFPEAKYDASDMFDIWKLPTPVRQLFEMQHSAEMHQIDILVSYLEAVYPAMFGSRAPRNYAEEFRQWFQQLIEFRSLVNFEQGEKDCFLNLFTVPRATSLDFFTLSIRHQGTLTPIHERIYPSLG